MPNNKTHTAVRASGAERNSRRMVSMLPKRGFFSVVHERRKNCSRKVSMMRNGGSVKTHIIVVVVDVFVSCFRRYALVFECLTSTIYLKQTSGCKFFAQK
jgi:hypothetical protein